MRNKSYGIIVIITAIALTGIIITQFFWVKDALEMKNDQFYQNAKVGLKRVVNQLMSLQNDTSMASRYLNKSVKEAIHTQFIESLEPSLIEDMITNEFKNLEVCKIYYYGIYNKYTKEFIMLNNPEFRDKILHSEHSAPISCIFQPDQFILAVYFPLQSRFVFNKMQLYIFLSALFMVIVIAGFWFVTSSLLRQKKLSEMKTDFVNNMTHELKTPIATISVTSEMLMKNIVQEKPEKINRYAEIIYNENIRLKHQVDQVLQVAILDRGDYKMKLRETDIHELINQSVDRFNVTVSQRGGVIYKRLNAANSTIMVDKSHISNVLNNLLDNANKYSPQNPEITISTHSSRKGVFVSVEDRGIGMPEEHIKHIFKKFHRIPTGDIHDVKGFGIGLFYVKTIAEAHGGNIKVHSVYGKGSKFILYLPYSKNNV